MAARCFILLALLLAGLCAAPARGDGGPVPGAAAEAGCVPYFPLRGGWLGGDAAYSVPLGEGRLLWLFGDTFIGREGAVTRRGAALIANSIALSECRAGEWRIAYHWGRAGPAPAPVFTPPDSRATTHELRYWPLDGFMHEGVLHVFLSRVRTVDPRSALGFAIEGVDMARVEGAELPPGEWRITYRPVLRGAPALPGAAVLKHGRHVLLYAPLTGDAFPLRPVALARLPLSGLDAPAEHLQFLAEDGSWTDGFDAARARRIMPRGATELSVHEAGDGGYVAVLNEAAFPADRIVLRTAPAPEGPWTEDVAVELFPERARATEALRARIFCYAAKAYEPASRGPTLLLTYVCNSLDAALLLDSLDLYRPRVKRVALPRAP